MLDLAGTDGFAPLHAPTAPSPACARAEMRTRYQSAAGGVGAAASASQGISGGPFHERGQLEGTAGHPEMSDEQLAQALQRELWEQEQVAANPIDLPPYLAGRASAGGAGNQAPLHRSGAAARFASARGRATQARRGAGPASRRRGALAGMESMDAFAELLAAARPDAGGWEAGDEIRQLFAHRLSNQALANMTGKGFGAACSGGWQSSLEATYEELLQLEDVKVTANRDAVGRLRQLTAGSSETAAVKETACLVCQEDWADGEELNTLPCGHTFHRACVQRWLKEYRNKCPVCKAAVQ